MHKLFKNQGIAKQSLKYYQNQWENSVYKLGIKTYFKKTNYLLKKDYYSKQFKLIPEILGVNKNSEQNDIKKAYFKLAKEWHPDVNKASGAKEKFSEISE
jgi:preprotein translocase subunit Sec63